MADPAAHTYGDFSDLRSVEPFPYAAPPPPVISPEEIARMGSDTAEILRDRKAALADEELYPTTLSAAWVMRLVEQCGTWAADGRVKVWSRLRTFVPSMTEYEWRPPRRDISISTLHNQGGVLGAHGRVYTKQFTLELTRDPDDPNRLARATVTYPEYEHDNLGPMPADPTQHRGTRRCYVVFSLTNDYVEFHMPEASHQLTTCPDQPLLIPRMWQSVLRRFQSPYEIAWRPPRDPKLVAGTNSWNVFNVAPLRLDTTPELWVRMLPDAGGLERMNYRAPMRLHYARGANLAALAEFVRSLPPGASMFTTPREPVNGPDNSVLRVPLKAGGIWYSKMPSLVDLALTATLPEYGSLLPRELLERRNQLSSDRVLSYIGSKYGAAKTLDDQLALLTAGTLLSK